MKVLGKAERDNYLCIVSHEEICRLMDKSTYGDNSIKELKIGDEIDLAVGYNFRNDIKTACSRMEEASKAFGKAQETMLKFSSMIASMPDDEMKG